MRKRRDTVASHLGDEDKVVSLQKKTLVWKRVDQDDTVHLRYVKFKMSVNQSTKLYCGELKYNLKNLNKSMKYVVLEIKF